jgi:solute carrier family 45, member 1/2/4
MFAVTGFLPLAGIPVFRLLGGDQFRKFCVVAMAILVATVWITCACHEEKERQDPYYKRRLVLCVKLLFYISHREN